MNLQKSSGRANDALGKIPSELQLQLVPGQSAPFTVQSAEACEVQWDISQVGSGSRRLAAGEAHTIPLAVPLTAQPRSLIRGQVVIRRADGTRLRLIPVTGWVRKPQTPKRPNDKNWPFGVKFLLVLLAVGAIVAAAWYHSQPPTLVVEPARIDFGTLWYSPPLGGHIQTALVFTAQWRAPWRGSENPVLVARKDFYFHGETQNWVHGNPIAFTFPLNNEVSEARIPLECYNLSNETVWVSGTVSLTVSNARARAFPSKIHFEAKFKPATESKLRRDLER
jgi:hypothetical protein